MDNIHEKCQVIIEGLSFEVQFPNNGQYISIQNNRAKLSPYYDSLKFMGPESTYGEMLVDAIAHFTILIPDFNKLLKKDILELPLEKGMELVDVYTNEFRPWYNRRLNFIFKKGTEEEVEEKSEK